MVENETLNLIESSVNSMYGAVVENTASLVDLQNKIDVLNHSFDTMLVNISLGILVITSVVYFIFLYFFRKRLKQHEKETKRLSVLVQKLEESRNE